MTRITTAVAAAAALTIAFAVPAHAGSGWGPAVGGFVAGTMIGAAAASSAYAQPAPVYRCAFVEKYDAWGNYIGTRRVCRSYY